MSPYELLGAAAPVDGQQLADVIGRFVETVARLAGALTIIGGFVWWLVRDKVKNYVRELASNQTAALEQLGDDRKPGTIATRARVAAEAAASIPELVARLERIEDAHLLARVELLEVALDNHGGRIGEIEQALIRDLAGTLRLERAERRVATATSWRDDQDRADRIRDRVRAEREQRP